MAGNSERKGAIRKDKKGPQVGSGGQRRKQLKGRGPTPKASERDKHVLPVERGRPPRARRRAASVRRQDVVVRPRVVRSTSSDATRWSTP